MDLAQQQPTMKPLDFERLDRSVIEVYELGKEPPEREFWLTRTPVERLQAMEFLRKTFFGYDPATARLQRVLEVIERP